MNDDTAKIVVKDADAEIELADAAVMVYPDGRMRCKVWPAQRLGKCKRRMLPDTGQRPRATSLLSGRTHPAEKNFPAAVHADRR